MNPESPKSDTPETDHVVDEHGGDVVRLTFHLTGLARSLERRLNQALSEREALVLAGEQVLAEFGKPEDWSVTAPVRRLRKAIESTKRK